MLSRIQLMLGEKKNTVSHAAAKLSQKVVAERNYSKSRLGSPALLHCTQKYSFQGASNFVIMNGFKIKSYLPVYGI